MIARIRQVLCLSLASILMAPAIAGSFSVSPTRIQLSGATRTAVMVLRNADSDSLTVQLRLVSWTQGAEGDVHEKTADLLATPPVFTLGPNSEQVLRIALRVAPDPALERSYRIFFEEVPKPVSKEFNGLNVALRIGVPIFVAPLQSAKPQLVWQTQLLPDGKVLLEAENRGKLHQQVLSMDVSLGAETIPLKVGAAKYLLPGAKGQWTLVPAKPVGSNITPRLTGTSDQGPIKAEAPLAARP